MLSRTNIYALLLLLVRTTCQVITVGPLLLVLQHLSTKSQLCKSLYPLLVLLATNHCQHKFNGVCYHRMPCHVPSRWPLPVRPLAWQCQGECIEVVALVTSQGCMTHEPCSMRHALQLQSWSPLTPVFLAFDDRRAFGPHSLFAGLQYENSN